MFNANNKSIRLMLLTNFFHCSFSMLPESIRKSLVFGCLLDTQKESSGMMWDDVFKDIYKDTRDVDLQYSVIFIVDFELIQNIDLVFLFFILKVWTSLSLFSLYSTFECSDLKAFVSRERRIQSTAKHLKQRFAKIVNV